MTGTFFACLSAYNAGGPGWIPGSRRSAGEGVGYLLQYSWASLWLSWQRIQKPLEKEKATHSSILTWRIPWTISSLGLQRVRHRWATFTFTCFYLFSVTRCYLNFCIAPTPVCMLHLHNEYNCAYPMWDIAQDNLKVRRHLRKYREFLSHPVLSLPSSAWAVGVIPGWKAEIPQASWPKTKNKKKYPEHRNNRSNIVTSSIKTLKL